MFNAYEISLPMLPMVAGTATNGSPLPSSERQISPLAKLAKPEQNADQLINAYDITVQLVQFVPKNGTICTVLPSKETHIRPLTKLAKPEH